MGAVTETLPAGFDQASSGLRDGLQFGGGRVVGAALQLPAQLGQQLAQDVDAHQLEFALGGFGPPPGVPVGLLDDVEFLGGQQAGAERGRVLGQLDGQG